MICESYIKLVGSSFKGNPPVAFGILAKYGRSMKVAATQPLPLLGLGHCYRNSLISATSEYVYCEGYACVEHVPVPLPHAWLMDSDGCVVDVTWGEGVEYYGVPFHLPFVEDMAGRAGYYSVFESLYALKMTPEDCFTFLEGGIYSK